VGESREVDIVYQPIGIIHSPFVSVEHMPVQPVGAAGIRGGVELFAEFAAGLKDLEGFSHIILLYHFHRVGEPRLIVMPFLDVEPHGVFATRAPTRPNSIGLSVVKLLGVESNLLHIENVDILDGTPLLDIKPYVPEFDHYDVERTGWLASASGKVADEKSDGRFGNRGASVDERRDTWTNRP
jgi:tRNA-Thr(GGU) m(6)t(6)A37 methyltransferase TsaA